MSDDEAELIMDDTIDGDQIDEEIELIETADPDEIRVFEEVRELQRAQLQALKDEEQAKLEDKDSDQDARFAYLKQSEIFAHFLGGGGNVHQAALEGSKGKAASGKKRKLVDSGKRSRISEEDEDRELMKCAQNKSPLTGTMRKCQHFFHSSSIYHISLHLISDQLEGLNWLMRLHDNNINGILADEMGLGKQYLPSTHFFNLLFRKNLADNFSVRIFERQAKHIWSTSRHLSQIHHR
jgi:hypothetical protein